MHLSQVLVPIIVEYFSTYDFECWVSNALARLIVSKGLYLVSWELE